MDWPSWKGTQASRPADGWYGHSNTSARSSNVAGTSHSSHLQSSFQSRPSYQTRSLDSDDPVGNTYQLSSLPPPSSALTHHYPASSSGYSHEPTSVGSALSIHSPPPSYYQTDIPQQADIGLPPPSVPPRPTGNKLAWLQSGSSVDRGGTSTLPLLLSPGPTQRSQDSNDTSPVITSVSEAPTSDANLQKKIYDTPYTSTSADFLKAQYELKLAAHDASLNDGSSYRADARHRRNRRGHDTGDVGEFIGDAVDAGVNPYQPTWLDLADSMLTGAPLPEPQPTAPLIPEDSGD